MGRMVIRRGGAEDIEPAVAVWLAANTARREGLTPRSEQAARARGHVSNPEAFLLIAEDAGDVVGMALGVQALSDDGAGAPVRGLCHISMVFVAPDYWGRGIGGRLVDALLSEARSRGYDRSSYGPNPTTSVPGVCMRAAASCLVGGRKTSSENELCTTNALCLRRFDLSRPVDKVSSFDGIGTIERSGGT